MSLSHLTYFDHKLVLTLGSTSGVITKSPTTGIETPKREKNGRQVLRSDEYTKMLSLAGANPRDYAILQVFLQTGIRVSELASLRTEDIDFR
jgi:integrase